MPQLHFYVPDDVANRVRQEASAVGMSVSQYLAEVVKNKLHPEWPEDFFEKVVGGWKGDVLERADQDDYDARDSFAFGENDVSP